MIRRKLSALILATFCSIFLVSCGSPDGYVPVQVRAKRTKGTHFATQGETLSSIAAKYGWDKNALARFNGLSPSDRISVGTPIKFSHEKSKTHKVVKKALHQLDSNDAAPVLALFIKEIERKYEAKHAKKRSWFHRPLKQPKPAAVAPTPKVAGKSLLPHWKWPAKGLVSKRYNKAKKHNGIDITGKLGDPIYASYGGEVVYSGSGLKGYGNLIIIKHDQHYLTAYAHNRDLKVHEGQKVKTGQVIATMGNTGAKQVKLHYEIRKQGEPVDPIKYLPALPTLGNLRK